MPRFLDGRKRLIGMIHLPPLPGSSQYAGQAFGQIVERALQDARTLHDAGFDSGIIQNTHDLPVTVTALPETIACLAAVGWEIRRTLDWSLGINILKNDAGGALAVAAAVNATFVRLKVYVGAALGAEGVLAPSAPEALRVRQRLGTDTEIWADLFDRTSVPLVAQPLEQLAEWATKFGGAAAVIVTGACWTDTLAMAESVRRAGLDVPVALGGGVQHDNVRAALDVADAVIVGSALEEQPFTGPISADKARSFVARAYS